MAGMETQVVNPLHLWRSLGRNELNYFINYLILMRESICHTVQFQPLFRQARPRPIQTDTTHQDHYHGRLNYVCRLSHCIVEYAKSCLVVNKCSNGFGRHNLFIVCPIWSECTLQ